MTHAIWWETEGSAMRPLPNEDIEEFAKRITAIAWSNGQYVERETFFDAAMKAAEAAVDTAMALEREACEAIEYDLAKSPAMFATMAEYKAYKDGVQDYRTKIIARGEA